MPLKKYFKVQSLQLLFSFFFLACPLFLYAQNHISGKVIDKTTGDPLAFANIIFNQNPKLGITADINGSFSYYSNEEALHSLTCSYVGYSNVSLPLSGDVKGLVIAMNFSANELKELVINPGENPANAIMRKVIANKERNNPENIGSFRYRSYNKVVFDFKHKDANDSINMNRLLKNAHIFMMESVTERKFVNPDNSEEVVLATKVSGFNNPSFASLATDLQPFSFYKDNIPFLDVNYLNPISKGSLNKYRFTLQDTLYTSRDTVYVISYEPLPKKNFEALTGLLYVNTNQYALQNVTASPYEKGKIDLRIQQQYTFTPEGYWFPQQLDYALDLKEYPEKGKGMMVQGKSFIDSIAINVPINKRNFRVESVWIKEDAAQKDSLFWLKARNIPLDTIELSTYRIIDSIGQKNNFDGLLTFMEKAVRGRIPIKYVDIDIGKTLVYNKYEGFRLGIGLYTNERLFKKLELGGFFGYGTKDSEWKYGGGVNYEFSKRNEFTMGLKYQDNLVEIGEHGFKFPEFSYYDFRSVIAYRMDRLREESFTTSFRALRYTKWNLSFNHAKITPKYDYAFGAVAPFINRYTNTTIGVNMRFAYKEKIVQSFGQNVTTDLPYPVLYLNYTKGLKGTLDGDFNYNKIEAVVQHSFFIKNLGKTTFRVEGGYIDTPLPYGLLFTGEGSYDNDIRVIIKNTFQTVLPYEFVSDRYVNLFTSHSFGGLLFKSGSFQPYISIHNNIGWGDLKNRELQQGINFKTKDKLYLETGLQADHLIKMNYVNMGYLGFGAGAFYRYGGYAYNDFNDNIVFKLTVAFTFK
ncbi:carboxypeptidase-like regulatory domain-containing protein [Flavobacterium sp. LaA7.5]|nr:carboxypeptidase-like regulatory domain-containing protein [Flavobacterium salilacus subsp. altitudinum]